MKHWLLSVFCGLGLLCPIGVWAQIPAPPTQSDAGLVVSLGLLALNGTVLGVLVGNEDPTWRTAADITGAIAGPTAMIWAAAQLQPPQTTTSLFSPLTFVVGALALVGVAADLLWRLWLGPTFFAPQATTVHVRMGFLTTETPGFLLEARF